MRTFTCSQLFLLSTDKTIYTHTRVPHVCLCVACSSFDTVVSCDVKHKHSKHRVRISTLGILVPGLFESKQLKSRFSQIFLNL